MQITEVLDQPLGIKIIFLNIEQNYADDKKTTLTSVTLKFNVNLHIIFMTYIMHGTKHLKRPHGKGWINCVFADSIVFKQ